MKIIKYILPVIACVLCQAAVAQDILIKRNGTKDTVKVEEITPTEIVYKKFKRLSGPNYRINKKDVVLIEYADGVVEVIEAPVDKNAPPPMDLGRNIISLNYMNIFVGNINPSYEYISPKGFVGIKLSLNYHIKNFESDVLGFKRTLTAGFDLNLYPSGQGKIKYFLGPAMRFGRWTRTSFDFFQPAPGDLQYNAVSVLFNNGFYIQPTPSLYIGVQGAVGFASIKRLGSINDASIEPDGIFGFSMGYRF